LAKALMIQGTGSGAGKSLIAAAFCRIFRDMGANVAPFKAQNMALNSAITAEGGEIGRAQVLQARAARLDSVNDMNPVLLKVSGNGGSQVIIHGKVHGTMQAREYYAFRDEAWKAVTASYARLAARHDLIVLEGAGSPAEINLLDVDIVNMSMAKHAKAPVLLVADIDKGGVFASLYGTVKLLGRDGKNIKAFIINKFRGDQSILDPGLDAITKKTGRPVIGVLPYISGLGLPEEDGLALQQLAIRGGNLRADALKIVVVRLQYISNFTDFDPVALEPDAQVVYSDSLSEIENADIVILPGSKNTVADLLLLHRKDIVGSIRRAHERGAQVIGICGGYQMLGKRIDDPFGAESSRKSIDGIGLLNIETVFGKEKTTCRAEAEINAEAWTGHALAAPGCLKGYEIHMGGSTGDTGLFMVRRSPGSGTYPDGSMNGNCWGTYLHGIFDNDSFRRGILNHARKQKGLSPVETGVKYNEQQEQALDRLAAIVRQHVDMDFIQGILKL
jgi:adenosylcobyric acid synthase